MTFWRRQVIEPALDRATEAEILEQQELMRLDPANPRPLFALGSLAHLQGRSDEAVQYFEKALELDPSYAAPHISLGRIYAVRADYHRAWKHAREASSLGDSSLLNQLERYLKAAASDA